MQLGEVPDPVEGLVGNIAALATSMLVRSALSPAKNESDHDGRLR